LNLQGIEFCPFPALEFTQVQLPNMGTDEFFNRMSQCSGNTTNLAFFAFCHDHLQNSDLWGRFHSHYITGCRTPFFEPNAILPAMQNIFIWLAIDCHQIGFGVLITRMCELVGGFAIIGQNHKSFTIGI
jgi:hypothetical protein